MDTSENLSPGVPFLSEGQKHEHFTKLPFHRTQ